MTDLALDTTTNDLSNDAGDLAVVTLDDETSQSLLIALRTGLGEWAFDTAAGVAYRGGWRVRPINNVFINADVRRVCLRVAGIRSVDSVDISLDAATREVAVAVECTTVLGAIARAEIGL